MSDSYENFYSEKYATGEYGGSLEMESHPFYGVMKDWLATHEDYAGKKFLEIGSGSGALQDVVEDYTGIDYADSVKANYHKPFFACSAESMPFEDESFDVIFSYAVWEHIPNPEKAFCEVIRILRNNNNRGGGYIFVVSGVALQIMGSRRLSGKTLFRL